MSRFDDFRRQAARKPPTKQHRPALWENMLGTVYAQNHAGETQYFDYDYDEALAFIGPHKDVRVYRNRQRSDNLKDPRVGQLVWWVRSA